MRGINNAQVIPFEGKDPTDKDGNDPGEPEPLQIIIDSVENGFILTHNDVEMPLHKVYLFKGSGDHGPEALIQDVIDALGLSEKVKLAK